MTKFEQLTEASQLYPGFDCEDKDLNDFLYNDALDYYQKHITITYLKIIDDKIACFFSISTDCVSFKKGIFQSINDYKKFTKDMTGRSDIRHPIPAIKITRLGVDKNHKSQGHGKDVIYKIIETLLFERIIGCRVITVDAYNIVNEITGKVATAFYENFEFKFLTEKDETRDIRSMFFDVHKHEQFLKSEDFYEGIKAAYVEKKKNNRTFLPLPLINELEPTKY